MNTPAPAPRAGTFARFARKASRLAGHPAAFSLAFGLVASWLIAGPFFGFSTQWQMVVNTATTIVTFLVVFLMQHTQNRDTQALHLKLDELVRSSKARNTVLDIEDLDEHELDALREAYLHLATRAREGHPDPAQG